MYLFRKGGRKKLRVQLLGSGTIFREVIAAADLLKKDFDVDADIWSVTSFNELRREGLDVARWNMMHPDKKPRTSYVEQCLEDFGGPVIAATDYMKIYADQIRNFIQDRPYTVMGTDGFGRSDTRQKLRKHFEVNRYYIVLAALKTLADEKKIPASKVAQAIKKYKINPEKPNPVTV
jgi:pyruvate dehydrogenase E1 component